MRKTMARRRLIKNRKLEEYVYVRSNGYVFYQHPKMDKPVSFKKDIDKANETARIVNREMASREAQGMASRILTGGVTFGNVIDRFLRDRAPELGWSKRTMAENMGRIEKFRTAEKANYESTDVRFFSDLIDQHFTGDGIRKAAYLLKQIDRFAVGKGMRRGPNVCDGLIAPQQKKRQRSRIKDYDQYLKIRAAAQPWLQRAMDFSLITLQPREVVCGMSLPRSGDTMLRVIRGKTGAAIAIHIGDSLQRVIQECRVEAMRFGSRKLICKRQRGGGTTVAPDYLSKAFRKAVGASGLYEDNAPTFHEIRSLGARMYKEAGYSRDFIQALAGHTEGKTTEIYLENGPKFTEAQALMELNR